MRNAVELRQKPLQTVAGYVTVTGYVPVESECFGVYNKIHKRQICRVSARRSLLF